MFSSDSELIVGVFAGHSRQEKTMRSFVFAGTIAAVVIAVPTLATADDVVVGNPGPVVWTLDDGSNIAINTQTPFAVGGAGGASSFSGSVTEDGAITFPASGIKLAPSSVTFSGISFTVNLSPIGDATATVNPETGVVTTHATFKVAINGSILFFPKTCVIPTLVVNASTTTAGGVPYDPATGTAVLVDDQLAIPAATNCGLYTGIINSQLKLPSAAGTNKLTLVVSATPPSVPLAVEEPTP